MYIYIYIYIYIMISKTLSSILEQTIPLVVYTLVTIFTFDINICDERERERGGK